MANTTDLDDSVHRIIEILEDMGVHHGQERYYSKEEMLQLLKGVYEIAIVLSKEPRFPRK